MRTPNIMQAFLRLSDDLTTLIAQLLRTPTRFRSFLVDLLRRLRHAEMMT